MCAPLQLSVVIKNMASYLQEGLRKNFLKKRWSQVLRKKNCKTFEFTYEYHRVNKNAVQN